jgi:hypothetical protein
MDIWKMKKLMKLMNEQGIQLYTTIRQSFPLESYGTYQFTLLAKIELLNVTVDDSHSNH